MAVRARTAATSLRARLAAALAVVLIGPIIAAVIAIGVLAPRAAHSAAERTARQDADSAGLALVAACRSIGDGATATAGEVQAYATEFGSLTRTAAKAAAHRAVSRRPGVAVAVLDAGSRPLAVAGAPAGLTAASAGGYGASCASGLAGDQPAGTGATAGLTVGLARRVPVNTKAAGLVGYVVFWAPLDDAALRALRNGLHTDSQISLLAADPGHRLLASSGAGANREDSRRVGSALRPAQPGLPFALLVTAPVPRGGPIRALGLAVLGIAGLALLSVRLIAGRLSGPMTAQLRTAAGELRASRNALADTFDRFGEALQNTHNLEKLLDTVAAACLPATGAVAGIALLLDAAGDGTAESAESPTPTLLTRGRACLDSATAQQAVVELPGFADRYLRDLADDPPSPLFSRLGGAGPVVAVPLRAGEQVIGVLALARGENAPAFDALALPRVRALAEQAGTAIHNVRLHDEARRLSVTDPLTGVGNVRQLSTTLTREVERATRFDRPLTVLMLDLDNFKQVNDTLGHAFGDLVLREFARRLQACVREVDTVARYGGEEFAVVLLETDVEGGSRVAERVLAAVRAEPFQDGVLSHSVTVSIGVAAFPRHGRLAAEVLQAADEALYLAKNDGRDRSQIAGISPAPSAISQAR